MTSKLTPPEDRAAPVLQRIALDRASSSEYRQFYDFVYDGAYDDPAYRAMVRNLLRDDDARASKADSLNEMASGILSRLVRDDAAIATIQNRITELFCG